MTLPKFIAMYLPQFYETLHNNEWWGEGFTEWTALKKAGKQFSEHQAPRHPLAQNYYDLSKSETLQWQADLAKKYGIDGFCFYHYYFENGQLELALPVENLLKHPEIDLPFCFNWANESWISSWSQLAGNTWVHQADSDRTTPPVLAKQNYGSAQQWADHFAYFLPFFKDRRYLKQDGQPLLIIYKPQEIPQLEEMLALWQKLARENGFPGLYVIGEDMNVSHTSLSASLIHEPTTSMVDLYNQNKVTIQEGVICYETKDVWQNALDKSGYLGSKTYYMAFTGFDDTARRGARGKVIVHNSVAAFFEGLKQTVAKSVAAQNEWVFINAWNEWGEQMYLEPDEHTGYQLLEQVTKVKQLSYPVTTQMPQTNVSQQAVNELCQLQQENQKYKQYTNWLDRWLTLSRGADFSFAQFMQQEQLPTLAIYGLALMGRQVYAQCRQEDIAVAYGIDRHVIALGDLTIYRPEEVIPEVAGIVITNYEYQQVKDFLGEKTTAKLYTLEDVLTYLEKRGMCNEWGR